MKKIPTEIYSRVVGYFRPVNQYNKGKQEEFKERVEYLPKDVFNSMKDRDEKALLEDTKNKLKGE